MSRRADIEDQIAEIPAQGLHGVAVKLALWQQFPAAVDEHEKLAVETAYETIVKLTGFDPAAQAETW